MWETSLLSFASVSVREVCGVYRVGWGHEINDRGSQGWKRVFNH